MLRWKWVMFFSRSVTQCFISASFKHSPPLFSHFPSRATKRPRIKNQTVLYNASGMVWRNLEYQWDRVREISLQNQPHQTQARDSTRQYPASELYFFLWCSCPPSHPQQNRKHSSIQNHGVHYLCSMSAETISHCPTIPLRSKGLLTMKPGLPISDTITDRTELLVIRYQKFVINPFCDSKKLWSLQPTRHRCRP